jgi:uncharacterized coiled-coil protein SlyX
MEDQLIALQEMVAHQAVEMEQLHAELYAQQKDIAALQRRLKTLTDQMGVASASGAGDNNDTPEPPPPHY